MIPFSMASGAVVALVVLHMLRPFFVPRRISAARFFRYEDEKASQERQPTLSRPWRSPPFFVQLAAFGLLAAALWPAGCSAQRQALGIWILLDTSASTGTRSQPGEAGQARMRFDRLKNEVLRIVDALEAGRDPVVFHLSTFDLRVRHLARCLDGNRMRSLLEPLEHRALGTDLASLRLVLQQASGPMPLAGSELSCALTHRAVISDLPAPEWADDFGPQTVWLHRATPVPNAGFDRLLALSDPLTGKVRSVEARLRAYGSLQERLLQIKPLQHPAARREIPVAWSPEGIFDLSLELEPGRWSLRLTPGDAYAYDDEAEINVPSRSPAPITITTLDDSRRAEGRATSGRKDELQSLELLLGRGFSARSRPEVGFFDETSSLLRGLDLDQVPQAGPIGVKLPPGFEPILTGLGGNDEVWLAIRRQPRAALIPALPRSLRGSVHSRATNRFASLTAANALHWLAEGRPPTRLFLKTTEADPDPRGNRLALHPGEGKTDHAPFSYGSLADLRAVRSDSDHQSARRWLVAMASVAFFVDQVLLGWWRSWR